MQSDILVIHQRQQLVDLAAELGVRPDWHEPDELDVDARVYGCKFDNAGFWGPGESDRRYRKYEEMHVVLYKDDEPVAAINLATLLSWASGYQS